MVVCTHVLKVPAMGMYRNNSLYFFAIVLCAETLTLVYCHTVCQNCQEVSLTFGWNWGVHWAFWGPQHQAVLHIPCMLSYGFSVVCQCFPIEYYYYSETWNLNWRSVCISQIFSTTGNAWWGCNLQCYSLHSKCVSSLKGRQLLTADAYCPSNSILPPSELWFSQEQEILLPELFCSSIIV